ncbi:DUF2066 domain-containing protein [Vibrio sp. WXL103]|uniref:DUF2066 domain-containing protein n=1 Tax=unclassified Vibrio TaxID=2614977 RepID=UPI003EC78553
MRKIALFFISLLSLPVLAMSQVNLYQSSVVIDPAAANGDQQARAQGLEQVIVRASGDADAASNPVIQKALGQTSRYVRQISYASQGEDQVIRLVFSEPAIRELLVQAELPYWPARRQTVLVWLAEDSPEQRAISWEYADTEFMRELKQQARVRGVPLTFPLGDFEDMTSIEVSDIWGNFTTTVEASSQRYPVDGVLVVRRDARNTRWNHYAQQPSDGLRNTQRDSASSTEAAEQIIDQLASYYSQHNALQSNVQSAGQTVVTFENVVKASQLFKLERGLEALSSVASASVVQVQADRVTFEVDLLSSRGVFEQSVQEALGNIVAEDSTAEVPQPAVPVQMPEPDLESEPLTFAL